MLFKLGFAETSPDNQRRSRIVGAGFEASEKAEREPASIYEVFGWEVEHEGNKEMGFFRIKKSLSVEIRHSYY